MEKLLTHVRGTSVNMKHFSHRKREVILKHITEKEIITQFKPSDTNK